jgi:hypothetical protein
MSNPFTDVMMSPSFNPSFSPVIPFITWLTYIPVSPSFIFR